MSLGVKALVAGRMAMDVRQESIDNLRTRFDWLEAETIQQIVLHFAFGELKLDKSSRAVADPGFLANWVREGLGPLGSESRTDLTEDYYGNSATGVILPWCFGLGALTSNQGPSVTGSHWAVLFADFKSDTITYYDSLPDRARRAEAKEVAFAFWTEFRDRFQRDKNAQFRIARCAPQMDGYSCGDHVLQYTFRLLRGGPVDVAPMTDEQIQLTRTRWVNHLQTIRNCQTPESTHMPATADQHVNEQLEQAKKDAVRVPKQLPTAIESERQAEAKPASQAAVSGSKSTPRKAKGNKSRAPTVAAPPLPQPESDLGSFKQSQGISRARARRDGEVTCQRPLGNKASNTQLKASHIPAVITGARWGASGGSRKCLSSRSPSLGQSPFKDSFEKPGPRLRQPRFTSSKSALPDFGTAKKTREWPQKARTGDSYRIQRQRSLPIFDRLMARVELLKAKQSLSLSRFKGPGLRKPHQLPHDSMLARLGAYYEATSALGMATVCFFLVWFGVEACVRVLPTSQLAMEWERQNPGFRRS